MQPKGTICEKIKMSQCKVMQEKKKNIDIPLKSVLQKKDKIQYIYKHGIYVLRQNIKVVQDSTATKFKLTSSYESYVFRKQEFS